MSASLSAKALSAKSAYKASELKSTKAVAKVQISKSVKASAEDKVEMATRRTSLGLFAAGLMAASAKPANAAYGQGANVFGGGPTNSSGYYSFAGDGYALLIPSKFAPNKEREFPGTQAAWADNFRVVNKVIVTVDPTTKSKIEDYGSPEDFVNTVAYMLGTNSWSGKSKSEGGFAYGSVSSAALLDTGKVEKKGKTYYNIEMLVRTADGDEGGKHQLFTATVSGGKLYVCKVQNGDKSWFKGGEVPSRETIKSFTVV